MFALMFTFALPASAQIATADDVLVVAETIKRPTSISSANDIVIDTDGGDNGDGDEDNGGSRGNGGGSNRAALERRALLLQVVSLLQELLVLMTSNVK